MTSLYNDFFRFPTLRYVLAAPIVTEGAAISISAGRSARRRRHACGPAATCRSHAARVSRAASPDALDRLAQQRLAPPAVKMILRTCSDSPRAGLRWASRLPWPFSSWACFRSIRSR